MYEYLLRTVPPCVDSGLLVLVHYSYEYVRDEYSGTGTVIRVSIVYIVRVQSNRLRVHTVLRPHSWCTSTVRVLTVVLCTRTYRVRQKWATSVCVRQREGGTGQDQRDKTKKKQPRTRGIYPRSRLWSVAFFCFRRLRVFPSLAFRF